MTKEELLIPRYLCESPTDSHYPYSPFKVGDIISLNQISGSGSNCCTINGVVYSDTALNKYPHLFRRLKWWEYRNEKDMPEYLRHGNNVRVRKVEKYTRLGDNYIRINFEGGRQRYLQTSSGWIPATAEEYEQFTHPAPGDKQ